MPLCPESVCPEADSLCIFLFRSCQSLWPFVLNMSALHVSVLNQSACVSLCPDTKCLFVPRTCSSVSPTSWRSNWATSLTTRRRPPGALSWTRWGQSSRRNSTNIRRRHSAVELRACAHRSLHVCVT